MQKLITYLTNNHYLNEQQLLLLQQQAANHYGQYLLDKKWLKSEHLAKIISQLYHFSFYHLDHQAISDELIDLIGIDKIRKLALLPIEKKDKKLILAISFPDQLDEIDKLRFQLQINIELVVVDYHKMASIIQQLTIEHQSGQFYQLEQDAKSTHFIADNSDEPVISFINTVIKEAIDKQATDIHFEPYADSIRIRFRIDGLLSIYHQATKAIAKRLIARLKIMAKLDIAEQRLPQDGRCQLYHTDIRISTCPTLNGEKILARLLNSQHPTRNIDELGMENSQYQIFRHHIAASQGMILVTGPTGSGKTTTLYAALQYLNREQVNICSIEDPIEIDLPGINQVNVQSKYHLNFSQVLRTFLRQDPDIIMIGEIRDCETAEIAIRAAQTGHLVLSTLHTNSSKDTILRLLNIGVAWHDIISSIRLITAQRLIRQLCQHCKAINHHHCQYCHQGYKGRMAIHEILEMPSDIHHLQSAQSFIDHIHQQQQLTLFDQGQQLIKTGLSSDDEINRLLR